MEHIRQFDWCTTEPDISFLLETDVDNCVTERVLRNKFHDPLVSSESEDEEPKLKLDWDEIFNKKKIDRKFKMVVQGLHPVPPFTKLSALTAGQHYQCLKVLSAQYPDVLPQEGIPAPTKHDFKVFELIKDVYEKEQKEFIEWAKSLWVSDHCVRALRPKPLIETVYEAEFKVRANALESFPKTFGLAAQIPLEPTNPNCELVLQKDIIKVPLTLLPQMKLPDMTKKVSIMRPCPVPEPCNKHPCRFILPTEKSMTLLPLTETHRELAQFAVENGAKTIASESALRCLVRDGGHWTVPVSVCQVLTTEGDSTNVVVLGSEVPLSREAARVRTYKAFRRLLDNAFVPPLEAHQALQRREAAADKQSTDTGQENDDDSDDDNDKLVIDTDDVDDVEMQEETAEEEITSPRRSERKAKENSAAKEAGNNIGFFKCTCKDSPFAMPSPRSYRSWRVKNSTGESYNFIVHTAHRLRNEFHEVILEPIPEYQLDLGASALPADVLRAQALAHTLRKDVQLLNVRIDSASGDIVTLESGPSSDAKLLLGDISKRIFAAMDQLSGLLPGHYLLRHEPGHGSNALLYGARSNGELVLSFDGAHPTDADADEAKGVKAPPTIAPVLLPVHKFRRYLPCAFTPHRNQLSREPRRAPQKQKQPPQAIKWPTKKKRKRKHRGNNNS